MEHESMIPCVTANQLNKIPVIMEGKKNIYSSYLQTNRSTAAAVSPITLYAPWPAMDMTLIETVETSYSLLLHK